MIKKSVRVLCGLALLGMVSVQGWAGFVSGTTLTAQWQEYKKRESSRVDYKETDAAFYAGYVEGIADSGDGVLFTIGGNVSVQQVLSTVGKWLEDHPKDLNKPADFLVTQALRAAYPLSEGK
ncbi:MAG: Rap1a/Tai family immunity protein [Acidobacteriia bacterium]|nr:Rap1a/Tai family immunity protein [Terriglobia bacterium]